MGVAERRERQKAALRAQILDAAREIAVREGLKELTIRKLADAIDYAPATIYLHFASRDDIARELCVAAFRDLLAALERAPRDPDPRRRLRALASAYVRFGIEHAEAYQLSFMQEPKLVSEALKENAARGDNPGESAFRELVDGVAALSPGAERAAAQAQAEVLWAALHGIVSLKLTCSSFLTTPADTLLDRLLDAWWCLRADSGAP